MQLMWATQPALVEVVINDEESGQGAFAFDCPGPKGLLYNRTLLDEAQSVLAHFNIRQKEVRGSDQKERFVTNAQEFVPLANNFFHQNGEMFGFFCNCTKPINHGSASPCTKKLPPFYSLPFFTPSLLQKQENFLPAAEQEPVVWEKMDCWTFLQLGFWLQRRIPSKNSPGPAQGPAVSCWIW